MAEKSGSTTRFRGIISFAVGLMVFLYVFRVPILSPLFSLGLEKSKRLTGVKLHIERIAGSCFYDFAAEGISIADDKTGLSIEVKRVSLEYDPLALLWGERVAKKIEVIRPAISIPVFKESEEEKASDSKLPDIARILEQTPDVRVVQASFVYRQKGQSILISGLDLENSISREGEKVISQGKLSVEKVCAQGVQLPKVGGSWRLSCMREKPIVLEKAVFNFGKRHAALEGTIALGDVGKTDLRGNFSIPSLKRDVLSLLGQAGDIPLDGEFQADFSLRGALPLSSPLDLFAALNVRLQNITWQDNALPTVIFSCNCSIDNAALDISRLRLSLDKSEICFLSGKLGYLPKSRTKLQTTINIDTQKIEEILTAFIGSGSEPLIPIFATARLDIGIEGKLPIGQKMSLNTDIGLLVDDINWRGTILPPLALRGSCQISDTLTPHLELMWGEREIWRLGGELGYMPGGKIDLSAGFAVEKIEEVIESSLKPLAPDIELPLAGDVKADLKVTGELPAGRPLALDASANIGLRNFKWQDIAFPRLDLICNCKISDSVINIPQISLRWDDSEIWRLTGQVGYGSGGKIDLDTSLHVEKIEKPLAVFLDSPVGGEINASVKLKGTLPAERPLNLSASIGLEAPRLTWQGEQLPSIVFDGNCKLIGSEVEIPNMRLALGGKEIWNAAGSLDEKKVDLTANFSLKQIEDLAVIFLESENLPLTVDLDGSVHVNGTLDPLDVSTDIDLSASRLSWQNTAVPNISFSADCKLDEQKLSVLQMKLGFDKRELWELTGTVGYREKIAWELETKLHLKRIEELVEIFIEKDSPPLVATANVEAKAHISGALEPLEVFTDIDLSATQLSWQNTVLPDISFSADCKLNDKVLAVSQMKLGLGEREICKATGRVGYAPGSSTKMSIGLNLEKIDELAKLLGQEIPVAGDVHADVTIEGKLPLGQAMELESRISLKAPGLVWQKTHFPEIIFDCRCNVDDEKAKVEHMWLKLGERRLWELEGEIDYLSGEINLTSGLELGKIDELAGLLGLNLPMSAKVIADFRVEGKLPLQEAMALATTVSFRASEIERQGVKFPRITFDSRCEVNDRRVKVKRMGLKLDESEVWNLEGEIGYLPKEKTRLKSKLKIENVENLLALVVKKPPLKGNIEGTFALEGTLPLSSEFNLNVKSDLALKDGILPPLRCKSLGVSSSFSLNRHTLSIDSLALNWAEKSLDNVLAIVNIKGFVGYRGGHSTEINAQIPIAALANRFLPMAGRGFGWQGKAPLQFSLKGQLPVDGEKMNLETRVDWPWTVAGDDKFWKINVGDLAFWGEKNGEKSGAFLFAKITGPLLRPSIVAQASMDQQEIRLGPAKVKNFSGDIIADDDAIIVYCKLNMGSGVLTVHGQIDHDNFMPSDIKILVDGKHLILLDSEEIYARADMRIVFSGKMQKKFKGSLKGSITVSDVEVNQGISLDSGPKRVFNYPNFDNPMVDLDLDLNIRIDKIAIEAPGASLTLRGDILVGGKASRPAIKGKIETTEGRITVFQEPMNITHCMVSLREEDLLKPYLDIVAETTRGNYRVIVKIKSPPDPPLMEFSSVPPLPQESVLTLFLTGMTPEELQGDSAGKKGVEVLSNMALQQLFNVLGVGSTVSARFTENSGSIAVDLGKGFGMEGEVDKDGRASLQATYRFRFRMKDLFGANED